MHSKLPTTTALLAACAVAGTAPAAELVHARDGSGVYGYKDTPVLPWCGFHVHDPDRPAPPRIDPGPPPPPAPVPADAIVLFDGSDASKWRGDCKVDDGCLVAGEGPLGTRESFGDIQLHLEWMAPAGFDGPWYNRGNNGVSLMGLYEIQIFDSFNEKLYPDGQAAAVYAQTPPMVNVTRPPGQWQSYDIIFTAPRFRDGKLLEAARVTMFHNGVLVHLGQVIHGETRHRALPAYDRKLETGPVVLAGHNCPVRFRNIWLRRLDPPAAGRDG
jgi:hypothetical protein